MTHKFKVGDRVAVFGVVARVSDLGATPYELEIPFGFANKGEIKGWFTEEQIHDPESTTFRDQAAIAALQGWVARDGQIQLQFMHDDAKILFDYAEALDAERKKRDGGMP